MKHMSWGWTLVAVVMVLIVLYAVWDFTWVHLIHSEAVESPEAK
jgi:formate-dependent nitrite reductase membrane component NrfD